MAGALMSSKLAKRVLGTETPVMVQVFLDTLLISVCLSVCLNRMNVRLICFLWIWASALTVAALELHSRTQWGEVISGYSEEEDGNDFVLTLKQRM